MEMYQMEQTKILICHTFAKGTLFYVLLFALFPVCFLQGQGEGLDIFPTPAALLPAAGPAVSFLRDEGPTGLLSLLAETLLGPLGWPNHLKPKVQKQRPQALKQAPESSIDILRSLQDVKHCADLLDLGLAGGTFQQDLTCASALCQARVTAGNE